MTQPPAILTYGTLEWWVAAFLADSSVDINDIPDLMPVNGSAFIVADIAEDGLFVSNTDTPLTLLKTRMELLIVDGHLQDRAGNRQVKVLACDSPGLSQQNWPYTLSFELDDGLTFGSFQFYVYSDEIVDLTRKAPFELVDGTLITKGDPGEAATIDVGSVTTIQPDQPASVDNSGTPKDAILNFYIPRGVDGLDGEAYGGGFLVAPVNPADPLELTVHSRWGISAATGEPYYDEDGVPTDEAALLLPDPFTGAFVLFKPGEPVPGMSVGGAHTHTADQISDSTVVGRALLTAATAAAQRTALGVASATGFTAFQKITAAAYAVLSPPDANTVYIVQG